MEDIDNQSTANYAYDAIGNMTHDEKGDINEIKWTVYGKIAEIARYNVPGQAGAIQYTYDPSGNRVGKKVYMYSHPDYNAKYDWYLKDAQGNVMPARQSVAAAGLCTQQNTFPTGRWIL